MVLRNKILPPLLGVIFVFSFLSGIAGLSAQEPPKSSPAQTVSPSPTPPVTPEPSPVESPVAAESPSPEPTPTPRPIDKVELHQALLDLTNPWTVMCVAAHPDDEDGTTLTVLRRKHGVHTVSLFSTYGEGGQNAVGPELYEELGVIRARETIAASAIQGSEPHFLGLRDFGFSKSAEETFRIWGHDEALRRMVQKIRELRPDVIITNHDTSRGHGHHQATGRLILEAFDAAADPKRFPEQLQRVGVWQPSRLFVRRFRFSGGSANPPTENVSETDKVVTIDPNERHPLRGTMYAEQALAALQEHASQGPWPKTISERRAMMGNPVASLALIRYQLVREAPNATPLPTEAKSFLDGLTLDEPVEPRLAPPTIDGRPLTDFIDMPDRVLNALVNWRRRLARAPEPETEHLPRVRLIHERGDRALALVSGVTLAVTARSSVLVPGVRTRFIVNLANLGDRSVVIRRLSFLGWGAGVALDAAEFLTADTETQSAVDLVTPTNAAITVPSADHLYDPRLFGEQFDATADLSVDGARFSVSASKRLEVVPGVEINNITPAPCVHTPATPDRCKSFKITLTNNLPTSFRGLLTARSTNHDWPSLGLSLVPEETRDESITSTNVVPDRKAISSTEPDAAVFAVLGSDSSSSIRQRAVRVVYSDARVPKGLSVGYLPSFDHTVEQSLEALGVNATKLSVDKLESELDSYDTVIIDNRGYQAHPELIAVNSKLLDFVRAGGTLIVFYHKNDEWNPDERKNRPQLAPYPIILGGDRVTEEDATVRFLQRAHPLLNSPNRIRATDFDGWIQERGLYYPKDWDRRYQALFEMSDRDEPPLRGGLLVAQHGRGHYIYTSMVWYRQLAAGVPGAYRMFANMISYGYRPGRRR